jgi:hypothetical protein
MHEGTWTLSPCPPRSSSALAKELDISEITASVLVRRGYGDPGEARAFLAGEQPLHDPFLLGDMVVAVERIHAAIAAGKRICVHGDYDVDGICATALAVLTLRALGADVEWHLPSRFEEGYGVAGQTLERLADEGFQLRCEARRVRLGCDLQLDLAVRVLSHAETMRAEGVDDGPRRHDLAVTPHKRPVGSPLHPTEQGQRPAALARGLGCECEVAGVVAEQRHRAPAQVGDHHTAELAGESRPAVA